MKILVKLFGKPLANLDMKPCDTIRDIKVKINDLEKIDIEQQRIVYMREPLDFDYKTLDECKITDGAIVYLMLRLFVKKDKPILKNYKPQNLINS